MTAPAKHPDSFYVCHRRYTGYGTPPGGSWGNLGGGPCDGPQEDCEQVIEAMIENWKDEYYEPDVTDFCVWHIQPGKPAEDCTAWALKTMIETMQERAA